MQCRGSTKEMSTHERNSSFFLCVWGLTLQGLLLTVRSRCVLMLVTCVSRLCCLSGRRRGLTLAESPGVVDVLLAHVTRSSPLEAPIGEDVTSCLGELQTTRWREHRTAYINIIFHIHFFFLPMPLRNILLSLRLDGMKICTYGRCCCDVFGLYSCLTCLSAFESSFIIPATGVYSHCLWPDSRAYIGDTPA